MKSRHKRLLLILIGLAVLSLGTWAVLQALKQNMAYFYTPTQVAAGEIPKDHTFRLGGMVGKGSLQRQDDGVTVHFVVTDYTKNVNVSYRGILPDLFKEGKGVVAQGKLNDQQVFVAEEVLAKHDENYMPPEAAYAMKKAQEAKAAKDPTADATATKGAK